jgi:hypothetical protein
MEIMLVGKADCYTNNMSKGKGKTIVNNVCYSFLFSCFFYFSLFNFSSIVGEREREEAYAFKNKINNNNNNNVLFFCITPPIAPNPFM